MEQTGRQSLPMEQMQQPSLVWKDEKYSTEKGLYIRRSHRSLSGYFVFPRYVELAGRSTQKETLLHCWEAGPGNFESAV